MDYRIVEKNKIIDVTSEIDDMLSKYHRQVFNFTRNEFDSIVQYDILNIMAFYYSKMNAQQKDVIVDSLENDIELISIDEILDNIIENFDEKDDDIYTPYSCRLVDRLADSRISKIVFETIFKKCTELFFEDWDQDNSYSNYLNILNVAYFKSLSYLFDIRNGYSQMLNYMYESEDFDGFIDSLYDRHSEDIDWDYDIDLIEIDELIEKNENNKRDLQPQRQELMDVVLSMEDIQRNYGYNDKNEELEGFRLLVQRTGIVETNNCIIQGFECHFCKSNAIDAEYIVVYQKDTRIIDIVEDEEQWSKFQKELYYEDIRQNIGKALVYIIYILDEDSDNIPIQLIESNKTYGRKYVFTEDEAVTFINGIVKDTNEKVSSISPIQEWDKILREGHLTGCMTETYASKKVEAYLDGQRFDADYYDYDEYSAKSTVVPKVKWIKSVDTSEFRNFCFDKKNLSFGQINLFYGANGSGKTSVLEAIEYGLTGEIRRIKDFKVKLPAINYPKVKVYDTEAGIHTFTPYFSKTNNKEIERVWYGVPVSRNKSNLNDNFNRFNAFDSEAAYKFIHESDNSEESFSSMFGNLMFGETVVDHEKKWQRYKRAFNERYTELRNELNEAKTMASIYEISLNQKKSSPKTEEIENGIIDLKLRKRNGLSDSSNYRYSEIYDEFNTVSKYVDVLVNEDLEEKTFEEIEAIVDKAKKQNNVYIKQRKEIIDDINKLSAEKSEIKQNIFDEQNNQNNLIKESTIIDREIKNWHIVQNVLEHKETILLAEELADESSSIDKDLYYVSLIEQRPLVISFLKLDSFDEIDSKIINEKEIELNEAKQLKNRLEKDFENEKKLFGIREQQAIELRKIGKTLAIDTKCPLCGHEYKNISELINLIDNSVIVDDKIDNLIIRLRDLSEKIENIEEIMERQNLIIRAKKELELLSMDIPFLKENANDYKTILDYVTNKNSLEKRKNEIVKQQTVLDLQGFSLKNIRECQEYTKNNCFYLDYQQNGDGDFLSFLEEKFNQVQVKITSSDNAIKEYNQKVLYNEKKEEMLKGQVQHLDTLIDNLDIETNRDVEQAMECIKRKFILPKNTEFYKWRNKYQDVFDKCELEIERIEAQQEIAFEKQQLDHYKSTIKRVEPMAERCGKAVRIFENMPSLSSFVEKGIRDNIQQISKFFKWMHHSGEFERLDIDENGIYAIRGLNQQVVRTYEMSTGQRSTIAMSVMFALHIAAPDAPQLLLLDEPLATMDDTQVLNVLDILKSLAEQNTQIFFTTANGIMIKLFKECFKNTSFDYKEFKFIKKVNSASEIKETSVNDTKTIEELSIDDLTLDFNQFAQIRDTLRRNQEKLIIDEEIHDGNIINQQPDDKIRESFFDMLNKEQFEVLKVLMYDDGKSAKNLSKVLSIYPAYNVIIEEINNFAVDFFGETVIETDDPLPWIDEYYKKELKNLLLEFGEEGN